jgi:hypothetical protein
LARKSIFQAQAVTKNERPVHGFQPGRDVDYGGFTFHKVTADILSDTSILPFVGPSGKACFHGIFAYVIKNIPERAACPDYL